MIERIKEHAAGDPSVRQWTIGEDAVLANCAADSPLPIDVPDTPAWLTIVHTRLPQPISIASTMGGPQSFMLQLEPMASSWHKLARYLARAAVHAAIVAQTPESIAVADAAIAGIAADPELADYHADAPR